MLLPPFNEIVKNVVSVCFLCFNLYMEGKDLPYFLRIRRVYRGYMG